LCRNKRLKVEAFFFVKSAAIATSLLCSGDYELGEYGIILSASQGWLNKYANNLQLEFATDRSYA